MIYTKLFRKKYLWVLLLVFVLIAVIAYYFFGNEVEGVEAKKPTPVKVCVKRNKKDTVVKTPCSTKKGVVIGTCLSNEYLDKPKVVNCKEQNKMLGWCTSIVDQNIDGRTIETSIIENCMYEKTRGLWIGNHNYSFFHPDLQSEVSFPFDKNITNNPNAQKNYDRAKKYLENIDIDNTIEFYRRGKKGKHFMTKGKKIKFSGKVKNISYELGLVFGVRNSTDIESIKLNDFDEKNKMLSVNVKFNDDDPTDTPLVDIIYEIEITGKDVEKPSNDVTGNIITLKMNDNDVIFPDTTN